MSYLKIGNGYIKKDYEGNPTGALYKYNGLDDQGDHEFQCCEFDCEDDFLHYPSSSISNEEGYFSSIFYPNSV